MMYFLIARGLQYMQDSVKNIVCNFLGGKIATFQAAVVQGTFSLG